MCMPPQYVLRRGLENRSFFGQRLTSLAELRQFWPPVLGPIVLRRSRVRGGPSGLPYVDASWDAKRAVVLQPPRYRNGAIASRHAGKNHVPFIVAGTSRALHLVDRLQPRTVVLEVPSWEKGQDAARREFSFAHPVVVGESVVPSTSLISKNLGATSTHLSTGVVHLAGRRELLLLAHTQRAHSFSSASHVPYFEQNHSHYTQVFATISDRAPFNLKSMSGEFCLPTSSAVMAYGRAPPVHPLQRQVHQDGQLDRERCDIVQFPVSIFPLEGCRSAAGLSETDIDDMDPGPSCSLRIAYGVNDCAGAVADILLDDVLRLLVPVSHWRRRH